MSPRRRRRAKRRQLRLGLLTDEEVASLEAAGAVGDCLAYFVDAEGRLLDHPINQRVIGLAPQDLKCVPISNLAPGGPAKDRVIKAALQAGLMNVVITDEASARQLLAATD